MKTLSKQSPSAKFANDIWILTKAGLSDFYGFNRIKNFKTGDNRGSIIKSFGSLLMLVITFPFSLIYYEGIAQVLLFYGEKEALSLLVLTSIIVVSIFCLFMSIYKASSFLFSFKDFDLLASFPISMLSILISKIMMLYVSNLLIAFVIGIPGLFIYGIHLGLGIAYYVSALILFFMFPIIPMLIGSGASLLLTRLFARFKYTNLLMIVGSFLLIIALVSVNFLISFSSPANEQQSIEAIINFGIVLREKFVYYFPGEMFARAIIDGSFLWFIISIALNLLLLFLFGVLFANNFKKLNALLNESHSSSNFKMTALKVSGKTIALYKKELISFFSSYIYVLNTGIGMVLLTFYSIAMLFVDPNTLGGILELENINAFIVPITTAIASFCIMISCPASVSISFEGKNLTILKSLPVSFEQIVNSKILLNLSVTIPLLLIDSIILSFAFKFNLIDMLILLLPLLSFAVLSALNGLMINLLLPKMDWKSHVQVVKQSASVIVTMLANMVIVILCAIICFVLVIFGMSYTVAAIILTLLLAGLCFIYHILITKYGSNLFNKISAN